ncbi:hypothetical protein TRVL_06664 [Trypanosoma vivax]|nr:hypothetical protein TRVL_06664 [Trypanosoma vivax]
MTCKAPTPRLKVVAESSGSKENDRTSPPSVECASTTTNTAADCGDDYFCPIFILSKGRFLNERGTVSLFIKEGVPFRLVVEKHEAALYEQLVDRLAEKWWGSDSISDRALNHRKMVSPPSKASTAKKRPAAGMIAPPPCTPPPPLLKGPDEGKPRSVRALVKIEVLPASGKGVSYARNHILTKLVPPLMSLDNPGRRCSCSRSVGKKSRYTGCPERWFWVFDDDIVRFFIAVGKKNFNISAREVFASVYSRIAHLHGVACDMSDVAIFSLEYSRYAFQYGDDDLALNSYNNIASLYRYDLIPQGMHYRFRIREDYDFTLQLISKGLKTARFRNLSFDVPCMAEAPGGMTDYYRNQKEDIRRQNRLFVSKWPTVAQECVKGKGAQLRDDIRVRWNLLNPRGNNDPRSTLLQKRKAFKGKEAKGGATSGCSNSTVPNKKRSRSSSEQRERLQRTAPHDVCKTNSGSNTISRVNKKIKMDGVTVSEFEKSASCHGQKLLQPAAEIEGGSNSKALKCRVKADRKWLGYVMKDWRYLTEEEEESLGLQVIQPDALRPGMQVAAVLPYFEQQPSVVSAILIEKHRVRPPRKSRAIQRCGDREESMQKEPVADWEWSAVADEVDMLTLTRCFKIPPGGTKVLAAAVDAFFEDSVRERSLSDSEI